AEILAKTGKTPQEIYQGILVPEYGNPFYKRVDSPINDKQKIQVENLTKDTIKESSIAGIDVAAIYTSAPGNNASIGGVKVELADGSWFAVRPSGTEPIMKLYIESYGGLRLWEKIHDKAISLIQ
ncbi:MAG: phosphoglucomutase, alpha-D-glucose phosphate-specific, partial [Desulfobacteraceae bacterium]|nr:phosphoglucomutase, alpha-D-glucose phosphate-specific [Desulfobacteraceae bacterium]